MKIKLFPIALLVLSTSCMNLSCTKEEIFDYNDIVNSNTDEVDVSDIDTNDPPADNPTDPPKDEEKQYVPREFTLYKESVLNQRSGIAFTWYDSPQWSWTHMPKMDTSGGWFDGGHQYGDVNNDGYVDILVSHHKNENDVELSWYINSGDNRNFTPTQSYFNESTYGSSAHKTLKTDVNNDGIADYIALGVDERVQGDYNGNFTVLIGQDDGTFNVNVLDNSEKLWFHNGAAGDLNGDGNVDVITATYLWWGDGTGNFTKGISVDNSEFKYTQSPLVYEILDMNNDGWNDLILRGPYQNTTIVINNNGVFDEFNETIVLPDVEYKAVMDIELVDFDNDGDWDIVELAQLGGNPPDSNESKYFVSKLTVYYNYGTTYVADENVLSDSFDGDFTQGYYDKYGWSVFKFDDIDGDGIDEIIAENYHDSEWNGLKKDGTSWKKTTITFGN